MVIFAKHGGSPANFGAKPQDPEKPKRFCSVCRSKTTLLYGAQYFDRHRIDNGTGYRPLSFCTPLENIIKAEVVAQAKAEQGLANWIALELRHLVPEMGSQFFGGIWHDLARLGIVFQGCLAQFLTCP